MHNKYLDCVCVVILKILRRQDMSDVAVGHFHTASFGVAWAHCYCQHDKELNRKRKQQTKALCNLTSAIFIKYFLSVSFSSFVALIHIVIVCITSIFNALWHVFTLFILEWVHRLEQKDSAGLHN